MKARKLKKNQLVEVEWVDIVSTADWLTEEKAMNYPATICKDVGYVAISDDKLLRISSSIQTNDTERNVTVIPWSVIGKLRKIKEK